jgi:hypothetical protein
VPRSSSPDPKRRRASPALYLHATYQLSLTGVAVEKLILRKVLRNILCWETLQTTIAPRVDIFYPENFGCFAKKGLFQHPQAFSEACVVCSPGLGAFECYRDCSPVTYSLRSSGGKSTIAAPRNYFHFAKRVSVKGLVRPLEGYTKPTADSPFQMARPMRLLVYLDVDSLESPC